MAAVMKDECFEAFKISEVFKTSPDQAIALQIEEPKCFQFAEVLQVRSRKSISGEDLNAFNPT